MASDNCIKRTHNFIDLTGKQFGRLTAVKYIGGNKSRWMCRCECGTMKTIAGCHLRAGLIQSCGCIVKSHGMSRTPEYSIWSRMLHRCYSPAYHGYRYYGGRGISVCKEWRESFLRFYHDMGKRPEGTTLDRVDGNGGYSPENCRWTDWFTQNRNKDNNIRVVWQGRTYVASELALRYGKDCRRFISRLRAGWPVEDALFRPRYSHRQHTSIL